MAKRGCRLILACRNTEKANTAAEVSLLLLRCSIAPEQVLQIDSPDWM